MTTSAAEVRRNKRLQERYENKYENKPKENIFEFVTESVSYIVIEYGLINQLSAQLGPDNLILGKRDFSILVPTFYYAIKDLFLPQLISKVVNYLANSILGRWILEKLVKIEKQKILMYFLNAGVIMYIQQFLGFKIDFIQILMTVLLEFGVDEASDYIF